MDIQTQTMPGAVKESLHPSVDSTGVKAARLEQIEDFLVHFLTIDTVTNVVVADLLPGLHGRINRFDFVRSAPAHNRAARIAEVAVLLRARKDIEDDRCVGLDRP